jgi:hypothetical protein
VTNPTPYVPTPDEWELAHALLSEHLDRVAAREFERLEVDRRIHDSLLAKKRAAEKQKDAETRAALVTVQTQEKAMRGQPGLDYLPHDACSVCGAVPWWNGRAYVSNHDNVKHGATTTYDPRSRDREPSRIDLSGVQRARRSYGEREDDD